MRSRHGLPGGLPGAERHADRARRRALRRGRLPSGCREHLAVRALPDRSGPCAGSALARRLALLPGGLLDRPAPPGPAHGADPAARHPDGTGEHLVRAGAGVAAYRKLRRHLLASANAALPRASGARWERLPRPAPQRSARVASRWRRLAHQREDSAALRAEEVGQVATDESRGPGQGHVRAEGLLDAARVPRDGEGGPPRSRRPA